MVKNTKERNRITAYFDVNNDVFIRFRNGRENTFRIINNAKNQRKIKNKKYIALCSNSSIFRSSIKRIDKTDDLKHIDILIDRTKKVILNEGDFFK